MKISVIMVDGGFRENIFGAEYFSKQDFPEDEYEVIWVDYYDKPHQDLKKFPNVKIITLNKSAEYHSSYCFNHGINEARGCILIIPDADQIVKPDFLSNVWQLHEQYEKLVIYGYRYNEPEKGILRSYDFEELEGKCILTNPNNYGGCLTVRKKWLLEINGYEQHEIFGSGFHANGYDLYTRFKNFGLAIQWEPTLKLYHPWHVFTLYRANSYRKQEQLIEWRKRNLQYLAFNGLDSSKNDKFTQALEIILSKFDNHTVQKLNIYKRIIKKFNNLNIFK